MRLTPIFDTSSLINLSREGDLDVVMKRLKPLIPSHGCPLSFVTTLELFRGLSKSDAGKIIGTLKPLLLAARISRCVVLRVPFTFVSWELFKVEGALNHRPKLLMDWLKKIQAPQFAEGTHRARLRWISAGSALYSKKSKKKSLWKQSAC
jgi:spore maturation protein SpmB